MERIESHRALFSSGNQKLKIATASFDCCILDNGQRILTTESVRKAMGYTGKSKNWLFEFLMHINRLTLIEPALLEALSKNVLFETETSVTGEIKTGIDSAYFLWACQEIVRAKDEGFLFMSELKFAKTAALILDFIDGKDINEFIDFACGFTRYKQNHKDALARLVEKNAGGSYSQWIKTFPDSFFANIFALRGWDWKNLNETVAITGKFIVDLTFDRLPTEIFAEIDGKKPKMKYRKAGAAEEYLQHPQLAEHLRAISEIVELSGNNQAVFEQLVNRTFPKQRNSAWPATAGKQENDALWSFNDSLRNVLTQKPLVRKTK